MDKLEYSYEITEGTRTLRGTTLQQGEGYAVRAVKARAQTWAKRGAKWRVWCGKWEKKGVVA